MHPAIERKPMKVLVKGAGDLASGIACRLWRCGFQLVMTDLLVPTTVRRMVAFSRAVYEEQEQVQEIRGVLCHNMEEIKRALARGEIPVLADEACRIREVWKPDVLVDAILAKRNLGTKITDAKIVVGTGPGFAAGVDCHAVVETKRGHDLGRCIWTGSAYPDTGVPGVIGGYDKERLIRANADGVFQGKVQIGRLVERGDLVGSSGKTPIFAQVNGVVRGLLQDGVTVHKGMKAGDIDPRGIVENCFTVSDKAAAIGGGVLEAILSRKKKEETL